MSQNKRSPADVAKATRTDTTFADLPVGTRVKVVAPYCDGYFFDGETGIVERNSGSFYGVIVRFDEPIRFLFPEETVSLGRRARGEYCYQKAHHGFKPEHLEVVS